MKTSEKNVQSAICEFLAAKKVRYHRMNAGDRLTEYKGKTYRIRGHEKGCADLLALPARNQLMGEYDIEPSRIVWPLYIEVKAPGKRQRPEQAQFQREVEIYGCEYLLADSVDTVIEWFKANKL